MRELPRLIAVTPGGPPSSLWPGVQSAVKAGLPGILLRQPSWTDIELLTYVRDLRALSGELWIGVHDRAHLGAEVQVDGVHLGFRSLAPREVRRFLRPECRVGFSAHAGDLAEARAGADYLFFGPVNETPSKRGLQAPTGLDGLRAACEESSVPVIALGGLAPRDVAGCLEVGAAGLACLSDILQASDPAARVLEWSQTLTRACGSGA